MPSDQSSWRFLIQGRSLGILSYNDNVKINISEVWIYIYIYIYKISFKFVINSKLNKKGKWTQQSSQRAAVFY